MKANMSQKYKRKRLSNERRGFTNDRKNLFGETYSTSCSDTI